MRSLNVRVLDVLKVSALGLVVLFGFSGCKSKGYNTGTEESALDTLYSDADVTISDCRQSPGSPGGGRQGFMFVGYGDFHRAEGRYRSYLRFEMNGIDPDKISSVELKLWKRGERADTLRLFAVENDKWDEYETVWDNAPAMGGRIASVYCKQGWNTVEVTDYVKSQKDNQVCFGFRVENDTIPGIGLNTRESGAPPMLIISHTGRTSGDKIANPGFPSSSELKHGVYIVDNSGNYKTYATISAAAEEVKPGQEIVLGPGIYYESFELGADGRPDAPLKIRGDGDPRPIIDGSLSAYWQPDGESHTDRALVYVTGDYWTVEHLEVRNAHPWGEGRDNSTCIYVHDASRVTIRDCEVYFGGDGIFSTSSTDNITLEYNEVAYNAFPGAAYQHGHYMNGRGWATVRFNYIHHNGGQNFKTRNEKCLFAYNYVHSPGNYQLDFVRARLEDQDAILIGNVVVTDNHPTNPSQMMVFGEDRHGGALELYNNTFINFHPRDCCFVHLWFPEGVEVLGTTLTAGNNVFYHDESYGEQVFVRMEKPVPISGMNNWFVKGTRGGTIELAGTVFGENPALEDMLGGDYRPAENSPLIDAGVVSENMLPEYQYVHPMDKREREIIGPTIDIGAYEYGTGIR